MGLLDVLRGKGLNPDGVGEDSDRTKNNKKVVDVIAVERDMDKWIQEDALNTHEANRLVHVMFRQIRQKNTEVRTKIELFLDQWAFHHGGITKDNFNDAIRAAVKYGVGIATRANQRREDAAFRQMQGTLAEFAEFDTPFGNLPGDEDFEKHVLAQHPELKAHKS